MSLDQSPQTGSSAMTSSRTLLSIRKRPSLATCESHNLVGAHGNVAGVSSQTLDHPIPSRAARVGVTFYDSDAVRLYDEFNLGIGEEARLLPHSLRYRDLSLRRNAHLLLPPVRVRIPWGSRSVQGRGAFTGRGEGPPEVGRPFDAISVLGRERGL